MNYEMQKLIEVIEKENSYLMLLTPGHRIMLGPDIKQNILKALKHYFEEKNNDIRTNKSDANEGNDGKS